WAAAGSVARGLAASERVLSRSSGAGKRERGAALAARGTLLQRAGDFAAAAVALAHARTLLVGDPIQWREVTLGRSDSLFRLGQTEPARALLEAVERRAETIGDTGAAARAALGLGRFRLASGDPWGALLVLDRARRRAEGMGLRSLEASI